MGGGAPGNHRPAAYRPRLRGTACSGQQGPDREKTSLIFVPSHPLLSFSLPCSGASRHLRRSVKSADENEFSPTYPPASQELGAPEEGGDGKESGEVDSDSDPDPEGMGAMGETGGLSAAATGAGGGAAAGRLGRSLAPPLLPRSPYAVARASPRAASRRTPYRRRVLLSSLRSLRLRACPETPRGPAARHFGGGQGGEAGASPSRGRGMTADPTPPTAKRAAARRVLAETARWLRCSSVTAP